MSDARWRPDDWDRPGELWTAGGLHALVLETTGAKTGLARHVVLGYLEDNDGWLVIGSKGGAPTDPAWVANLAAQPDATVVMVDGDRVPVRAERLTGADYERAWERIGVEAPEYVVYRPRTTREIPVIRLSRHREA